MRTLEEITQAFKATSSRFTITEAEELAKLNTISHCLESVWLSYSRARAFPDAPRDNHAIGCIMRSQEVDVLRDVHVYLYGEIARMFPRMADTPKAAALLRCYAALIRILDQIDESTHEEFSSIARALMPVAHSSASSSSNGSMSAVFASIVFTCVSSSESILEELYSAGYVPNSFPHRIFVTLCSATSRSFSRVSRVYPRVCRPTSGSACLQTRNWLCQWRRGLTWSWSRC